MLMHKIIFTLGTIFFSLVNLSAQSDIALGTWKSHLAYKEGRSITQSTNKIIYASQRGLITIDKGDLSAIFLAKEDGMSGSNVSIVKYDKANDQLIIVYTDNTIDIYKDGNYTFLPFIRTNPTILGSKKVNDVYIQDDTNAYFATDFGVLGFDLKKLEFSFTTFTDDIVFCIASLDNTLYAGTDNGLFSIALDNNNITNFLSWKREIEGLGPIPEVTDITAKYGQLWVVSNNTVYNKTSTTALKSYFTPTQFNDNIRFVSAESSELMIGIEDNRFRSSILYVDAEGNSQLGGVSCINVVRDAIEDEKGRIWYADLFDPLRYSDNKISGCQRLTFDVPFANSAGEVSFKNKKVFIASGGATEDYQYTNTRNGFYTYIDNDWSNYNQDNIPLFGAKSFDNVQAIVPHPDSDDIYVGSYYSGIIKYNPLTNEAVIWDKENSLLQGAVGDIQRTRIASLVFDKEDNLWISNFLSPRPLVVKTKDDKWYSFAVPGSTQLGDIAIDAAGNKWVALPGVGNGLLAFYEGNSLEDTSDDKSKVFNRNNSEISGNKVNCVVVDLDQSVWVGTDKGPVVFDCGNPFIENCRGNTRKVVVDNIPAPLLSGEEILSIEVDGANRKWFGTRNGIFVQSPDGIDAIAKFDINNSPLLDNKVTDLSYNGTTGEMWITSSGGMQAYRTETAQGRRTHTSDIYAFPNPVRPEYNGPIAIKGLVRDANVKITDINGRLVYETKSLGGQAIWDGNDVSGRRVSDGVYLVFSANENISLGTDAYVTKILVIR